MYFSEIVIINDLQIISVKFNKFARQKLDTWDIWSDFNMISWLNIKLHAQLTWGLFMMAWREASFLLSWCTIMAAWDTTTWSSSFSSFINSGIALVARSASSWLFNKHYNYYVQNNHKFCTERIIRWKETQIT